MGNLELYKALSEVPDEAKREIGAGRLKGKTDINPMWRIKALTEQFGPCGIGWKYEITRQWLETGAKDEISAFCNILLYIKMDGEWSAGIPGTGGSAFVANERNGPYTSDECYKMALTDALSVACKALGVAASVYWNKDPTKYTGRPQESEKKPQEVMCTANEINMLHQEILRVGGDEKEWVDYVAKKSEHGPKPKKLEDITKKQFIWSMKILGTKPNKTAS
jgi:hypothetical protein